MFLLHRKVKSKPVRGGVAFEQVCPACGEHARFVEVEIIESLGVFFIDVLDDKERGCRCTACGETFELKTPEPAKAPPKPAPPVKSAAELACERAEAERQRLEAERQRREAARAKAVRIEAELARERAEAERRRLEAERQRREAARAKAVRIEDELAELKKRMGR